MGEPSFSRLFSHLTWKKYANTFPLTRWHRVLITWHLSTVLRMLREPVRGGSESLRSPEDVLRTVLPGREVEGLMSSPNIPLALLGQLRMVLAHEQRAGRLQPHIHMKLEEDLRELNTLLGDNQRLFHSPIPPTMSRHVTRCLMLWLSMLPPVLYGRMPAVGVVLSTVVTTFIFVGMEEIGAQVEPPFEIMPLWQLCNIIARDAEFAFGGAAQDVDATYGAGVPGGGEHSAAAAQHGG